MTQEKFDEFLQFVESYFHDTASIEGIQVFIPQNHSILMLPELPPHLGVELIRIYCKENNVADYCVISEAWAIPYKNGEDIVSPEDRLDRQEILFVANITKNEKRYAYAHIIGYEPPARFLGNWKYTKTQQSQWDIFHLEEHSND